MLDAIEIFERCLQAIEAGTATIEECVARYPQVQGLEQMLRTVQSANLLPQGALSPASRRTLERRLIAQINTMPVKPVRRFPLTLLAASGAVAAVVLIIVVATTNRVAIPQVVALPTLTPAAVTAAPAGDFAVAMTLSGTIQSVQKNDAGGLTVVLDDGTPILVASSQSADPALAPGQAITVTANFDENNQLVASSLVVDTSATAQPTAASPAVSTTQATSCLKSSQPVAARLAASFDVTSDEILRWFCQGFGFGEIAKAYVLAQQSGKYSVAQILAMRKSGEGWGQLVKKAGVSPSALAHALNGNGSKPGNGPKK